jgi:hypothetical protein
MIQRCKFFRKVRLACQNENVRHFLRMWLGISIGILMVGFIIYFVAVVRVRLKQKRARQRAEELSAYHDQ